MCAISKARVHAVSVLAVCASLAAVDCVAQTVVSNGKITLDLTEAPATLNVGGGANDQSFGTKRSVELRLDDGARVDVQVGTPNRVLFIYKARDVVATDTANKVAADKLAEAISGFIQEMGGGPKTAAARGAVRGRRSNSAIQRLSLEGIDLTELARRIEWVMNAWNSATPTIEDLVTPSLRDNAINAASSWNTGLRDNDPSQQLANLPNLWRKLISPAQSIRCVIEYADGQVDEFLEPRSSLIATLVSKGVANAQMYVDVTMAIHAERKTIVAQVSDVRELASAISAISPVTLASLEYTQEKDQVLTVDVSENSRFAALLGTKAKAYQAERIGSYSIVFSPYELIHMRPSLGVIYSFVKAPRFTTERNAAGELQIATDADEFAEYGGLVSMDFTSDRYFRKGIQPFLQVGVSPSSDNLGIAVGIGVRAYKSFTLSLGAVYQRVHKLESGLAVGDVLESEDELKTSKEFKVGFYLGLGVKLQ